MDWDSNDSPMDCFSREEATSFGILTVGEDWAWIGFTDKLQNIRKLATIIHLPKVISLPSIFQK
jgi:hypothetical protein